MCCFLLFLLAVNNFSIAANLDSPSHGNWPNWSRPGRRRSVHGKERPAQIRKGGPTDDERAAQKGSEGFRRSQIRRRDLIERLSGRCVTVDLQCDFSLNFPSFFFHCVK